MSNLFAAAVEMLNDMRVASMSSSVTYRRGEQTLTLLATPSKRQSTPMELLAGYGASCNRMDFIFTASDLTLGLPAIGDTVTLGGKVYEAFEIDGKAFANCDPDGTIIRMFTVET